MSLHLTNQPRHAAPRVRSRRLAWFSLRLPAGLLRPLTLVPAPLPGARIAEAAEPVPSLLAADGHMARRGTATPTERVRVIDPADDCFGVTGIVSEYYGADAPIVVSIPVPQPSGGHRFERRQYGAAQLSPVLDTPDPANAPTLVMESVVDRSSGEAVVCAQASQYCGLAGRLVERDEEGGFELELPGVGHLVHFEASEVEIAAEVAR